MPYQNSFRLFMISAMYENGGNTTHRFLWVLNKTRVAEPLPVSSRSADEVNAA